MSFKASLQPGWPCDLEGHGLPVAGSCRIGPVEECTPVADFHRVGVRRRLALPCLENLILQPLAGLRRLPSPCSQLGKPLLSAILPPSLVAPSALLNLT